MTFVLDNLLILLLIGGGIVLLTLIQTWLAYTHDKVVANAGPIRESEELRVEIEHREAKKLELDAKILDLELVNSFSSLIMNDILTTIFHIILIVLKQVRLQKS